MNALRLAVSVMPLDNRRDVLVGAAVEADRLGYHGFFLPETWALDAMVVLTEAALKTERIVLGTGIVGVWGRSAGMLAMAAATLASVSGGRFILGLGASTAQLTEGLHDVPFTAPLGRVRRAATQVQALLRGERIPLAVATQARPLKLNLPAGPDVPIYVAALTDASVRMVGEVADGWLPFLYPRSRLAAGIELMQAGGRAVGRTNAPPAVCPSVPAVVEDDAGRARDGAAWFVAFYLTTMGPLYRESLVRQGFGTEVEAVLAANTPKFAGAVPPAADRLLEELTVFGTPSEVRARLAPWYAAGADMPILLFRPNLAPEQLARELVAFRS